MNAENIVIGVGFLVIGITVGFLAMFILRMAIHARKFQFAGCLAVVTTLSGGGPLFDWFLFWFRRISLLPTQSDLETKSALGCAVKGTAYKSSRNERE